MGLGRQPHFSPVRPQSEPEPGAWVHTSSRIASPHTPPTMIQTSKPSSTRFPRAAPRSAAPWFRTTAASDGSPPTTTDNSGHVSPAVRLSSPAVGLAVFAVSFAAFSQQAPTTQPCVIVKRHVHKFGENMSRFHAHRPFDYVEGDYPSGFKWRSELSDGDVREIQQKGGKVVVMRPDYELFDLEDARKQCQSQAVKDTVAPIMRFTVACAAPRVSCELPSTVLRC